MPLHLVTPIDQAEDARADSDSLDLPAKGWRSHAADLCYIVLRGSTFLGSSYLMALGLPLLFFLLISGGDAGVFFAHLANISDRFLGAEQGRQIGFLDEFKFVLIGVATLVVVWRLPRFIVNRRSIGTPYRRAKGTPLRLCGSVDAGRVFRAAGGVGRA